MCALGLLAAAVSARLSIMSTLGSGITPLPDGDVGQPYKPCLNSTLTTVPATPVPGEPTQLIYYLYGCENMFPAVDGDLALIYGYRIHVHIVSDDLSEYGYIKYEDDYSGPQTAFNANTAKGLYYMNFTFPKAGRYAMHVFWREHYFDTRISDIHPFGNQQTIITVGQPTAADVTPILRADYAARKLFNALTLDPMNANVYLNPISSEVVNSTGSSTYSVVAQISSDGMSWEDINTLNSNNQSDLQSNLCYVVRITYYSDAAFSSSRSDLGLFVEAPMQFFIIKDDFSVWNMSWADQLRADNAAMVDMPMCYTYMPSPWYHQPENGNEGGVDNGNTLGPFQNPFGPTVIFSMYFPENGIYRLFGETSAAAGSQLLAPSFLFRVGMGPIPPDPSPTPAPTPAPTTPPGTGMSHVTASAAAAGPAVLPIGSAILMVLAWTLAFE